MHATTRRFSIFSTRLRSKSVTDTSEEQNQMKVAGKSPKLDNRSGHKTISALAIFALGLNAVAAVYTASPSDFALPNVSRLAELLPHTKSPAQVQQTVVAALRDIQSAQKQHLASLQETSSSLQQNAILLQQRIVYDRFAAAEHHGRTSGREEHFGSDCGRARRRKETVCFDFNAYNKGRCVPEFQCAGHNLVNSQGPSSRAACDAQKIGSRGKAYGTDFA